DLHMPGISGIEAIRQIASFAPLARVLVLTISDHDEDVLHAILAGACGDVLKLISSGKDNAMIAAELHISPKTVKNHISNILMKLQIENRIQAAVYAV